MGDRAQIRGLTGICLPLMTNSSPAWEVGKGLEQHNFFLPSFYNLVLRRVWMRETLGQKIQFHKPRQKGQSSGKDPVQAKQ